MPTKLYTLATMSESPAIADAGWLETIRSVAYCAAGHPKQRFWRSIVRVRDRGADLPYNFVQRLPFNYIRDDLFEALSPYAQRCLTVGRLVDREGNSIEGVQTIRSMRTVRVRGGNKSYCWRCNACREIQYFPIGKCYVLGDQVPEAPIFSAPDLGWLIINEPLRRALFARRWKRLAIDELSVLDEPLDGFPKNLNKINPRLERQC